MVIIILLAIMTSASSAQVICETGYSCYSQNNIVWVKEDAGTLFSNCEAVCSAALAKNTDKNYLCDDEQDIIYDINSFSNIAQGLGFTCAAPGSCWDGKTGSTNTTQQQKSIWVTRGTDANKKCFFPTQESGTAKAFDCTIVLGNANCFFERFSTICPCKSTTTATTPTTPTTTTTTTTTTSATSPDNEYCVSGPTGMWGPPGINALKGNYKYGGQDSNNNNYWFISLYGDSCVSYKILYLRKSMRDGRYEIATQLDEDRYITRCQDDGSTPESCKSWSSNNFHSLEWVSQDALMVLKGKCPDIQKEKYLVVSQENVRFESEYGCNGEFTKDTSRNNIYIRNERYVNPKLGEINMLYAWYFNYPSQFWECERGYTMQDFIEKDTNNRCRQRLSAGPYPDAKLSFHN